MSIASELLDKESTTEFYQSPQSSLTCVSSSSPVQLESTEDLRTWLQGGSRASHFPQQVSRWEPTIPATCGPQLSMSSMRFDPDTASLRTLQLSLIPDISEPSSETWPKAGIVCVTEFYPQVSWERRIGEIGYGLWPTPNSQEPGWVVGGTVEVVDKNGNPPTHHNQRFYDKKTGRIVQKGLPQIVNMWPTPRANERQQVNSRDNYVSLSKAVKQFPTPTSSDADKWNNRTVDECKDGGHSVRIANVVAPGNGGQLSPDWTEWLMGWPTGWTSLKTLTNIDDWLNETQTGEWWQHEHDLPRVERGISNRTDRLKAIGNGQVPVVVATAWKILTHDLEQA